jgi:hypothetical protein
MVASLLLLVMLAGLVPLFLQGLNQSSTTRYRSVATNVGRQLMEQVRKLDYREIDEGLDSSIPDLSARFGTTHHVSDRNMDFDITYEVQPVSDKSLKNVKITVTWVGPPEPSPVVIQTMIHQMYLGPRGDALTVDGTSNDPEGTPFPLMPNHSTTVRYHIADADWPLVYSALNPASSPKNVYMRLGFVDDVGAWIPLGDPDNEYKIDNTHLHFAPGSGVTTDVWFEYDVDVTGVPVPDGYWNLRAIAYNAYDQPGNAWTLRVRVEKPGVAGVPAAPTNFKATGEVGQDDQLDLSWVPGPEQDRDHWVIERSKYDSVTATWSTWTMIKDDLPGNASSWIDENGGNPNDPWGDGSTTNWYRYRIYAVDTLGNFQAETNSAVSNDAMLPWVPPTTTTLVGETTTTTDPFATTTTVSVPLPNAQHTVTLLNNSTDNNVYVTVKDAGNNVVFGPQTRIKKDETASVSLVNGSYNIYLGTSTTVHKSFTVNNGNLIVNLF